MPIVPTDQDTIDLETLITSPNHRRRGAATLLLRWGMDQARALNIPIYLHASPVGLPLYQKFGFRKIGSHDVDLSSVSSGTRSHACMIWDPSENANEGER